jgi:hypothetical protein
MAHRQCSSEALKVPVRGAALMRPLPAESRLNTHTPVLLCLPDLIAPSHSPHSQQVAIRGQRDRETLRIPAPVPTSFSPAASTRLTIV